MSQYIVRFSFIVLATLLNACGSRGDQPTPSIKEQKKSALQAEIKELETQRKALISKMIADWDDNSGDNSQDDQAILIKQGDIEGLYAICVEQLPETEIQASLNEAKKQIEQTGEDTYSKELLVKAILEKNVYKIYASFFFSEYIYSWFLPKPTKAGVEEYFKDLEEQNNSSPLTDPQKKRHLQLLQNWKVVEPILILEQEKREELKKL